MTDANDRLKTWRGAYREAAAWITTVQMHFGLGPEASPEDVFTVVRLDIDEAAALAAATPPPRIDPERLARAIRTHEHADSAAWLSCDRGHVDRCAPAIVAALAADEGSAT